VTHKVSQPDLVDLHVHSSASDGVYSPREVVERAAEVGLKAVALTDHDTTAGVAEALDAGEAAGIEVIPGVEISAEFEGGACHILGYFVEPGAADLARVLEIAREGRARRNAAILACLNDLGFDLTMDDVTGRQTTGTLTRAHFAAAMTEKGYVRNWEEAFEQYLGRGKPAYVGRKRVEPTDAIAAIRGAGGLAALAHPRQLNRSIAETETWLRRFAEVGIEGVEVWSPDHTANYARHYGEMARRLGLLATGGSDWHGRADGQLRPALRRDGPAAGAPGHRRQRLARPGRLRHPPRRRPGTARRPLHCGRADEGSPGREA